MAEVPETIGIGGFCGLWIDDTGRVLEIVRSADAALATLAPTLTAPPYLGPVVLGSTVPHPTRGLAATWVPETRRLRIEVGTPGLGPTYQLELADHGRELRPSVHIGLYDDHDDDLGVPWAEPLRPYRRATLEEARAYESSRRPS